MSYQTDDADATSPDMKQYSGAKNNRLDRFEAEGNRFRVEGVPDHIQDTTVYVKDEIMFLRKLQESVATNVYDLVNLPNALDIFSHIYRFPSFPTLLPAPPTSGRYVPDPFVNTPALVGFRRWPLNRTFLDVEWRAANSSDSFKCNVVDTVEIQPWLCHGECTDAIGRTNRVDNAQQVWYDHNTKKFSDSFNPPDVQVPYTHKGKVVVVRQGSVVDNNGIIALGDIDNTDARGVSLARISTYPYFTFTFDNGAYVSTNQ